MSYRLSELTRRHEGWLPCYMGRGKIRRQWDGDDAMAMTADEIKALIVDAHSGVPM